MENTVHTDSISVWTVFFMRFILKLGVICGIVYCLAFSAGLISDNAQLKSELIRMHIVANSDSPEDQAIKLQVRDAILEHLQPVMQKITDKEEACRYIRDNLQKLEQTVNQTLEALGENKTATVRLVKEEFGIRKYDTFSLPSGIYDALRVEIGEGEGQNWWCVAFPSLCVPATTDEFVDAAASSGFSDTLVRTVVEDEEYEIRFFFMDLLGRMENFFH